MASATPASGTGDLAVIPFEAVGPSSSFSTLTFSKAVTALFKIECSLQTTCHLGQNLGRKASHTLNEFTPVQRGDLMAQSDAGLSETTALRNGDNSRAAQRLPR